jgi:hypothetical protein
MLDENQIWRKGGVRKGKGIEKNMAVTKNIKKGG